MATGSSRTARSRVVALACAVATVAAGAFVAAPAQAALSTPEGAEAAVVAAAEARAERLGTGRPAPVAEEAIDGLAAQAFGAEAAAVAPGESVHRVYGQNRWQTAVAVSWLYGLGDGGLTGVVDGVLDADEQAAPVVYVANGMGYADALSAAPAAAFNGGPLLLTPAGALPTVVREEIERLHPERIVVVGGTASVSDAAYAQLAAIQPNIRRDAGRDRYETSRVVVQRGFDYAADGVAPSEIAYLASGTGYADALAASAAAATVSSPVVLVNGRASAVDAATTALLRDELGARYLYLAGGDASISPAYESTLASAPWVAGGARFAGQDRYGTANAINGDLFGLLYAEGIWAPASANYTSGLDFPDALSAGAMAGYYGEPLYLSRPSCIPAQAVNDPRSWGVGAFYLVGGPGVLGAGVESLTTC
ncbi:cell wall-binding repeat-containing protein [Cellulosimicrobium cellulans]|uniref:cell wall-binding repeat-containing protein n=1 Tax=Cellulosimicrobium cellulans TaxID=1710 RepID=UPI0020984D95|nr:cell wall-binding repeat-containing protein [Cellulosimicrobium cellulans]MCO7274289.1 cell wall-binding repeat-containing protein [Cellulosimicrobium cellulans]